MATVAQQPRINQARIALISAVSLMATGFVGLLAYAQRAYPAMATTGDARLQVWLGQTTVGR